MLTVTSEERVAGLINRAYDQGITEGERRILKEVAKLPSPERVLHCAWCGAPRTTNEQGFWIITHTPTCLWPRALASLSPTEEK